MADNNNNGLLIAGGVLAIIYFGIIRPTTNALGLTQSAADKEKEEMQNMSLTEIVEYVLKNQQPTKIAAQWQLIADTIYNDLGMSSIADNKDDAVYQVCRVQNDADVAWLLKKFGMRQEYAFGLPNGGPQNLIGFLTGNLSASQLDTIRWNHNNKGIKLKIV